MIQTLKLETNFIKVCVRQLETLVALIIGLVKHPFDGSAVAKFMEDAAAGRCESPSAPL